MDFVNKYMLVFIPMLFVVAGIIFYIVKIRPDNLEEKKLIEIIKKRGGKLSSFEFARIVIEDFKNKNVYLILTRLIEKKLVRREVTLQLIESKPSIHVRSIDYCLINKT